jgi:hypothetical protein
LDDSEARRRANCGEGVGSTATYRERSVYEAQLQSNRDLERFKNDVMAQTVSSNARPHIPYVPSGSGSSATLSSTAKGFAIFAALLVVGYSILVAHASVFTTVAYGAVGAVAGATLGAALFVAAKIVGFVLRIAFYVIGAALVLVALASILR